MSTCPTGNTLKRTEQCVKCPWKKGIDPHDIPNGYSVEKHKNLKDTIASDPYASFGKVLQTGNMRVMACHEEHEAHCVGWLMNQLGPGNNIGLRIAMWDCTNIKDVKLHGEQHERFEDTLPDEGDDRDEI